MTPRARTDRRASRPDDGQAELAVERVDGLVDGGIVVGVDDGDGLAGAVEWRRERAHSSRRPP